MAFQTDSVDSRTLSDNDSGDNFQQNHDDPLLDCLMVVCQFHNITTSRNALIAGLPLEENRLTLSTLPRAAQRAGLKARTLTRSLDNISALSLPAIILLKNAQAAVLLGWDEHQRARLLSAETQGGEISVSREALAAEYRGQVVFIQREHEYNTEPSSTIPRTKSWFKDTLKLSKFLYVDAVVASFLINLIALATPLFVMNVYDRVVPNHATATL